MKRVLINGWRIVEREKRNEKENEKGKRRENGMPCNFKYPQWHLEKVEWCFTLMVVGCDVL